MKAPFLFLALAGLLSTAGAATLGQETSSLTTDSSNANVDRKSIQNLNANADSSSDGAQRILQNGPIVAPPRITSISIDPPNVSVGETISITLCVSGAGDSEETRVPFEVVFAIDTSGSMGGQKLLDAKAATNFLVGELIAQDTAAVVSWNTGASTVTGGLINDFAAVTSAVNGLSAGGGTNLDAGLAAAVNILVTSGSTESVKVIVFLTDGQGPGTYVDFANGGQASVAANNGIIIYSIGLGAGATELPLMDMADNTGGEYLFAPDSTMLSGIFDQILQTVQTNTLPYNVGVIQYVNPGIEIDCTSESPMAAFCNSTAIQWDGLDGGDGLRANETVCVSFEATVNAATGTGLQVLANNTAVTFTPVNDADNELEVVVSEADGGAMIGDSTITVDESIMMAPPGNAGPTGKKGGKRGRGKKGSHGDDDDDDAGGKGGKGGKGGRRGRRHWEDSFWD